MTADVQAPDDAVALRRVNSGSKRQRGTLLRRGKLHLGQVVNEEVEFGGNAAQTGLNQPVGEQTEEGEGGSAVREHPLKLTRYISVPVMFGCLENIIDFVFGDSILSLPIRSTTFHLVNSKNICHFSPIF